MPRDVKCHETWNATKRVMYTATVVGLWLSTKKSTKSLHLHDEQVSVAPCSYFLLHIATRNNSKHTARVFSKSQFVANNP